MKIHEVQPGEDMITIATKFGIVDWQSIYNHKFNSRLKEFRPDPMCLTPGDIVIIPDLNPVSYVFGTNRSHTIQVTVPVSYFCMQLIGEGDKPLANVEYELDVGDQVIKDREGPCG